MRVGRRALFTVAVGLVTLEAERGCVTLVALAWPVTESLYTNTAAYSLHEYSRGRIIVRTRDCLLICGECG
jgi:hypothetical protein